MDTNEYDPEYPADDEFIQELGLPRLVGLSHTRASTVCDLERVEIDALVALRIERHAREFVPNTVTGSLTGIERDGVLSVTSCFRHLPKSSNIDSGAKEKHQKAMLDCLEVIYADTNIVGWYQAASLANFFSVSWLQSMFDLQTSIPQSVVLEYDPLHSLTGCLSLRAYRLTSEFFDMLQNKSIRSISTDTVSSSGLLTHGLIKEIPVFIKNSSLVTAYMHEMMLTLVAAPVLLAREDFVERKLSAVLDTIDYHAADQAKFAMWQRNYSREKQRAESILLRAGEDVESEKRSVLYSRLPQEPSKVEALLLSHQVSHHFKQINYIK